MLALEQGTRILQELGAMLEKMAERRRKALCNHMSKFSVMAISYKLKRLCGDIANARCLQRALSDVAKSLHT